METRDTLRNLFGDLTFNSSTTNLTLGDTLINASIKRILGMYPWPFLVKIKQQSTVANQQFYELPYNFGKLKSVTITIGDTQYTPREAPNINFWNRLNQSTVTSDIPEWYIILDGKEGFYPIAATATADAIENIYKIRTKDLSIANYTTGEVGTATSGTTTVFGSSTVWTEKMDGRWLRITDSDTANTGDGEWYEISSVINGTTMVLVKNYTGDNISSGSAAYAIGQTSSIPEGFDDAPAYDAAAIRMARIDPTTSAEYRRIFNEKINQLIGEYGSLTDNVAIEDDDIEIINPNLTVTL